MAQWAVIISGRSVGDRAVVPPRHAGADRPAERRRPAAGDQVRAGRGRAAAVALAGRVGRRPMRRPGRGASASPDARRRVHPAVLRRAGAGRRADARRAGRPRWTPAPSAAGRPRSARPRRATWLVSLDLPIEAATPAEAVRLFWSYVQELGPGELPTFVSPVRRRAGHAGVRARRAGQPGPGRGRLEPQLP